MDEIVNVVEQLDEEFDQEELMKTVDKLRKDLMDLRDDFFRIGKLTSIGPLVIK